MDATFDLRPLIRLGHNIGHWFATEVLVTPVLVQAAAIPVAFFAAWLLSTRLEALIRRLPRQTDEPAWLRLLIDATLSVTLPILWFLFQVLTAVAIVRAGMPDTLLTTVVRLLLAWIVIRLATALMRNPALARSVAVTVWVVAALNILGVLGLITGLLDDIAFKVGKLRISLLTVVRGALVLAVMLWAAGALSRLVENRLGRSTNLTPSVQVLFAKVARIALFSLAFVVALRAVGIDLTGLALFSGAIGLGLGFGLQKVVSNLVSGLILLIDRSVKPGDVIAIGNTYGWVNQMGARYASVITRDGIEHLIPNEELITQRVENWSHSSDLVRLKVPIGVSYETDVPKAIALCIEAAQDTRRVLDVPKPACLLRGFGESAVNLELRFWISDVPNGIANIESEVLLKVWEKFRANGVEIPFPQRELHVKGPLVVRVSGMEPPADQDADAVASPEADKAAGRLRPPERALAGE